MLKIQKHQSKHRFLSAFLTGAAMLILLSGLYLLTLIASPSVAPLLTMKPIDTDTLPIPKKNDDRIIIPKIGVDIPYGTNGMTSLNEGALWRYSERGNPVMGGNFIIAAHRFSIQPTPMGTVIKSPFYNIDKLVIVDTILIDYLGNRYAYQINKIFNIKPTQTEIEAPSTTPKLTVYSCELAGSDAGRVVLTATPLGRVAVTGSDTTN